MALTKHAFPSFLLKAFNKEIDLDSDAIKVLLVTGYTFDPTDVYLANIGAVEVTGTGYTAGGQALSGKTVAQSSGLVFDAADVTWAASTISATGAILYDAQTGSSATEPLIAYLDFGQTISSVEDVFSIVWDAAGIFAIPES